MADSIILGNGVTFDPSIGNNPIPESSTWDHMKDQSAGAFDALAPARDAFFDWIDPGRQISGDEANQWYGHKGATDDTSAIFDPNQTYDEGHAMLIRDEAIRKEKSDFIDQTRSQTWATAGAGFVAGAAGFLANPENDAFFMTPQGRAISLAGEGLEAVGLTGAAARSQALVASMKASVLGRIGLTGVDNATGTALMQPLILAGAQQDHQDYSFVDAAKDVLYSAAIPALLHAGGSAFSGVAGATWRASMRQGIEGMENGVATPELNEALFRADRSEVVKDLTEQNGQPPTEAQIQAEQGQRYGEAVKIAAQKTAEEEAQKTAEEAAQKNDKTVPINTQTPSEIAELARNGEYDKAADGLEKETTPLETEPSMGLTGEDKAQANEPMRTFAKIKAAIADFTTCVGAEIA